jgi:hypothetical protein
MTIPLSDRTENVLKAIIKESLRARVRKTLVTEVGKGIPFCEKETSAGMDRIRFAVIKLTAEDVKNFDNAVKEAKTDWRDLLMEAGFGYSIEEHNRWYDKILTKIG